MNARFRTCTTAAVVRPAGVVDDLYDQRSVDFHLGPIRLYLVSEQGAGEDVTADGEAVIAADVVVARLDCDVARERALTGVATIEIAITASSTASRDLNFMRTPC